MFLQNLTSCAQFIVVCKTALIASFVIFLFSFLDATLYVAFSTLDIGF